MAHVFRQTLAALLVAALPSALCAMQTGGPMHTQLRGFSECVGRLAAMSEDPSVLPELSPEQIRSDHSDFSDLLGALLPDPAQPDLGKQAMAWRVRARANQTGLLRMVIYGNDERRARIALATIRRHLMTCHHMLPR